tara:strand:- start:172 stop:1179 length:1008 start_codon:yes stop_codon:yes gene_type:complete
MKNLSKPIYIAEIGSNHSGYLNSALNHITQAASIGFNAVKFQFIQNHKIWHNDCDDIFKLSKKEEFPSEWFKPIRSHCKSLGINVGYSPTFEGASKIIKEELSDFIKVASPQSEFDKFILDEAIDTGLKLIISNGYSDFSSTKETLEYVASKKVNSAMLFCVSEYPADNVIFPYEEAIELQKLCKDFGIDFGFSDHYKSMMPALSLANIGASVFEKHFILDNVESLDKSVSLNINESAEYIKQLNYIYDEPKITRNKTFHNKRDLYVSSFYLKRDVLKGEKLYLTDFTRKRNCKGDLCNTYDLWKLFQDKSLNKYYLKNMKKGDRLNNGDFKIDF